MKGCPRPHLAGVRLPRVVAGADHALPEQGPVHGRAVLPAAKADVGLAGQGEREREREDIPTNIFVSLRVVNAWEGSDIWVALRVFVSLI